MIPDSPAPPGRRALLVLVGLVGAHVAGAGLLAAQFAVSPVIVQLAHDPTGAATLLRIDNEGEDAMQFRVYAVDFDQDRDGEVAFAFRNPGDWPLRPSGAVEIRDAGGAVVATAPVPAFSVLPEHERRLRVSLPLESAAPGRYLAVPILDFGADYLAGAQADFRIEE